MPATICLNACLLGTVADAVLRNATRLEVVSVFSRSAYARDDGGNLVCFLKHGLEPGPLNILCSGWPENELRAFLSPGDMLTRVADNAWRSENLHIAFDAAIPWEPPPWPRFDPRLAEKGVSAFLVECAGFVPADSLASLFFNEPAPSPDAPADSIGDALFAAALPGIRSLNEWLRGEAQFFDSRILSLMGLGKGLTPSGDDLLGGALLALRAAGMADARLVLSRNVSAAAGQLTNAISAAHLSAAIGGLGAEALHLFIISLLRGGAGLSAAAGRLSSIGHTSGWDAAAGAVLAIGSRLRTEWPGSLFRQES